MLPVEIHTTRLRLDLPVPSDADVVTRYCRDPLFEQYLTTPWPYEHAHAQSFLGEYVPGGWASASELTWAIRPADGGTLMGVVSVRETQNEIGFWLGAEHRGSGFMGEAANAVCAWVLAGGIPGATTVFWRAVEGNTASARVARAAGFRRIEPANPTVPTRDGTGTLPAWYGVREAVADARAEASWNGILEARP